jgi:hypothetical protein
MTDLGNRPRIPDVAPLSTLRAAACAECGREFQSHAQYTTSRGAVICRDVDGCGERQFAERFADRGVR